MKTGELGKILMDSESDYLWASSVFKTSDKLATVPAGSVVMFLELTSELGDVPLLNWNKVIYKDLVGWIYGHVVPITESV